MPSGGGAFRETQDRVLDSAPQALTSCPRKGKAVTASLADIGTVPPTHTHTQMRIPSWSLGEELWPLKYCSLGSPARAGTQTTGKMTSLVHLEEKRWFLAHHHRIRGLLTDRETEAKEEPG